MKSEINEAFRVLYNFGIRVTDEMRKYLLGSRNENDLENRKHTIIMRML